MSCFHGQARLRSVFLPGFLVILGAASCSHDRQAREEARVNQAFASCQSALINNQTDQAVAFFPRNVRDYLKTLNSDAGTSPPAANPGPTASPGVDLLLRTALEKKVPPDLRATLTLDTLMRRIADKHLLNLRDVQQINLGQVSINGDRASAEIYYQGTLTALRLPFVKEGPDWKIDLMAVLPYAEVLMRLDRAVKGETEAQQVEQLVSKLPSL